MQRNSRSFSKTRFVLTALAAVLLLAASGCGSDGDGGTNVAAGSKDTTGGLGDGGSLFGDGTGGIGNDTGSDGSTAVDTAEDTGNPGNGCEFGASPAAGEAGAACEDNTDCDSGFCVKTAAGGQCTRTCTECCPSGWACEQAPSADTVYICLPQLGALCLPCQDDAECEARNAGSLCIGYGEGEAYFCGGGCKADADCPAGYACKDSKGTAGQAKQCVRASGLCECGETAIQGGMKALCTTSNEHGTCSGARTCASAGLGSCDAKTPAAETCNGQDDDCDGTTDEDVPIGPCEKTNEFGTCKGTASCAGGNGDCSAKEPAAEACNGVDDDCDGKTDEGCDDDQDGYCAIGVAIADLPASCTGTGGCQGAMPPWCSKGIGDCDDADKASNPGAVESCGDSKDNDCDGVTDAAAADVAPLGCTAFYADADKDGFGDAENKACLCKATVAFPASDAKDCNDKDQNVKPGAKEVCGNGKDDDCDGSENQVDASGCTNFYADKDGDGYGAGAPQCLCAAKDDYKALAGGDCDDGKKAFSPIATETCDGFDEDCDGSTDEEGAQGCKSWYADGDKDGWGDPNKSACLCGAQGLFVTLQGKDCNDGNPVVHGGMKELCYDSIDNDCDSTTDEEGGQGCVDYYLDSDKDGYGDPGKKKCLCDKGQVAGYTAGNGKDCDDSTGSVSPDATEICDGKDNDCDGKTDTGCDKDADGYCDDAKTTIGKPAACPKGGGDCNDDPNTGGAGVHPGAKEICNGKDDNCGSGADEGCDDDSDGYCDKGMTVVGTPSICPKGGGDCADTDKAVNPGAKEICNDKDDNCTGGTDEGCDDDKDGFCDKAMTVVGKPKVCSKGGGDCCDADSKAFPGQTAWYSSTNQCGGYDYNCSGSNEQEFTIVAKPQHICEGFACLDKAECIADPKGWEAAVPACGTNGTWVDDYQWDGSLSLPLVNTCKKSVTSQKTQRCH
ncbi:MAG: putative metal-binding motif-containing protein [Deltaproteobacteria bacterium]|nr:putative metal-binding motif-containing protein [Deltaproteobacteria bacterium]